MGEQDIRLPLTPLKHAVQQIFVVGGLAPDRAAAIAQVLVEADAIGHATHGLALASDYYDALLKGAMAHEGEPVVVADQGACLTWDGQRLPGAWLVSRGLAQACDRAREFGTAILAIANSHHVGALAAYLPRATDQGMMAIIASSTPSAAGVAPYGGIKGVFTPDPLAAGIPTKDAPILLDISASITTRNNANQLMREGKRFPAAWALDAHGQPTDDPSAVFNGGSLLPVGGIDHGHKGYAMALLVEALTQGLSGVGRSNPPEGIYSTLFIQVIDPRAFAGLPAYTAQTQWLAQACRDTPVAAGAPAVRVPGDRAANARRRAEQEGVPLRTTVYQAMLTLAQRASVTLPEPKSEV